MGLKYLLNYLGEDGGFASVLFKLANPPPLFFEKIHFANQKMKGCAYSEEADLILLQDFYAAAISSTDPCCYLYPGERSHHLFNGNKYYDPAEVTTIWESPSPGIQTQISWAPMSMPAA